MKTKSFLLATLFVTLLFQNVKAQSCDPWIVRAYNELFGEAPNSTECNIKNYNNGSWRSYEELRGHIQSYVVRTNSSFQKDGMTLTGDPFIIRIYQKHHGRYPSALELNIKLYNGGSWNNYGALKNFVAEFQNNQRKNSLDLKTAPYNGNVLVGVFQNGKQIAASVVAAGSGNVIAAGSANVVAAGSANVVSAGSANVASPSGGYIRVAQDMPSLRIGEKFTAQSVGTKVIPTSGSAALIIK